MSQAAFRNEVKLPNVYKFAWTQKLRRGFQVAEDLREDKVLSILKEELVNIDMEMTLTKLPNILGLFNRIALEVFGKLLLDIPSQYSNIKAYFSSMASENIQKRCIGNQGERLLNQSAAFMKKIKR